MKKKIAEVLSGCGVYDGAEIHEATLTLLAIHQQGADYQCFAPDVKQAHVINHLTGEEMPESRNVLLESARIARGNILALSSFNASEYDAIIFPGGFGVAKNLSDYAFRGAECRVNPEVEMAVKVMVKAGKPIGALCIAPVVIARILGDVEVTIGSDQSTAADIRNMGGTHISRTHGEVAIDQRRKVVSTPCYMLNANIDQIYKGAQNTVKALLSLM